MFDRTFHISTYGCQMNVNDSQWLQRSLIALGFTPAPAREARFHILNTCSVRDKPEHKVYTELGHIRLLAEEFPERGIVICVGGCVAQQAGQKLFARSKELRLVFGTDGIAHAPEAIASIAENPAQKISLLNFSADYPEKNQRLEYAEKSPLAYVNIMQGCNNFCSYCIVPFVRGRQKSRHTHEILEECRKLISLGARDITLLGQNVNSFGQDKCGDGTSFVDLLYKVAALPGLGRLRFVTPHPKDMPPELIRAFAELPVLAARLHLPMQSGSDAILKAMGRKYNMTRYLSLVESLKKTKADIQIATDIIVGFPGETDKDFKATMQAMREVDFAGSFSFVYSDRPGTRASKMDGKISRKEALARLSVLQKWQIENTERILKTMHGRTLNVLLENKIPDEQKPEETPENATGQHGSELQALDSPAHEPTGTQNKNCELWYGRDEYGCAIKVPVTSGLGIDVGDMLQVKITGSGRNSLKGELI